MKRLEVPAWICAALIAGGAVAGLVNAAMSIRHAQRLTVDTEGWAFALAGVAAVTVLAFLFGLASGGLMRTRRVGGVTIGLLVFFAAGAFLSYTITNSIGFAGYQILNKVRSAEAKQKTATDIAEVTNRTILQERKELQDFVKRTYVQSKKEGERDVAFKQLESLTSKPLELQAPPIEVSIPNPSAWVIGRLTGWDADTVQAISTAAQPILLVIGELLGPLLGTFLWPVKEAPAHPNKDRPPKQQSPASFRQLTYEDARSDVQKRIASGQEIGHGQACAERWGVSEEQVSKWLAKMRREGLIRREQRGRRKVVVPAHANGSANVVSLKPA